MNNLTHPHQQHPQPAPLALPAGFGQMAVNAAQPPSGPYVIFATPKSDKWAKLVQQVPGLQEPDPVLIYPDPTPAVKLSPFKFFFLQGNQHWIEALDNGDIVRTFKDEAEAMAAKAKGVKVQERIESCLLAFTSTGLVPVRCGWRDTKCPAAKEAVRAFQQAQTPEWAGLSGEHAASLAMPTPQLRFTATVRCVTRTSKSSGRKYWTTEAEIKPITSGEMMAINEFLLLPSAKADLQAVADSLTRRLEHVASKRAA